MLLAIASKPIDTNTTYTVGADVSRFQRSTVPSRAGRDAPADPAKSMSEALGSLAGAMMGRPAQNSQGGEAPAVPTGPVVRIARGNNITVVPVGAK